MNKKVLCGIMALCMAASFTGCGNTEESESASESNSSSGVSVSDNSESSVTSVEEESSEEEPTTENVTEPATEDKSELYAYYDDLSAEYEKYGENFFRRIYVNNDRDEPYAPIYHNIMANGKVICCVGPLSYDMHIYDMASKETKTIDIEGIGDIYYSNNFIYTFNYGTFEKYDMDWNIIQSGSIEIPEMYSGSVRYISEDGTVFLYNYKSIYMVSSDFKTVTEVALPTYEAEHGISKTVEHSSDVKIVGENEDSFYAFVDCSEASSVDYLYTLDKKTMEWNGSTTEIIKGTEETSFSLNGQYISIGKYLLSEDIIYNMETEEVTADYDFGVCTGSFSFADSSGLVYTGGKYFNTLHDGTWYKVQYIGDGSEEDENFDEAESMGTESSRDDSIYKLDDTYYVVRDGYGIFLRTYEKGESEEETIALFED